MMKLRALFTLLLFAICFVLSASFCRPTHTLIVTGECTGGTPHIMSIVVVADSKVVASTRLDSALHYNVFITDYGQEYFDFFITAGGDTLLLQSDALKGCGEGCELNFTLPMPHERTDGKAICPKCRKTDEVAKIIYGESAPSVIVEEVDGKKIRIPCIYGGTCTQPLLPVHWYCRRDKVKF